jgi:tetratricopeptide (TPR) repeat protein
MAACPQVGEIRQIAIAEFRKVRTIVGNSPYGLSRLGYAYARAGKKSEALKVLNELFQFSTHRYSVSYDIAVAYHGLGDNEKTFEWLEKALYERGPLLSRMKTEPLWDTVRSEPRFIALLKKIGLDK